ncbi:unnamed protein product [Moneuplotes crassus]|uniref:Calmodulin n=2 Tax=Euplotes crassus TaxID=5936 RepID=A0AAD2D7A5_EUPCR|nr:unnamed protein product [Moneuplotes crassus]
MSSTLDEVQIAEIREIFTLLDKNSDGLVSTTQLGLILRGLRYHPSDAEIFELQKKIDPNNTTSFDQNSLISLVAKLELQNNTIDELVASLNSLNPDENSSIPFKTLVSMMSKYGETMSEGEIIEVVRDLGYDPEHDVIDDEAGFCTMLLNKCTNG